MNKPTQEQIKEFWEWCKAIGGIIFILLALVLVATAIKLMIDMGGWATLLEGLENTWGETVP